MAIPIIGEPTVEDFFVTYQVKCPCGAQFLLSGKPGKMQMCKGTDGKGAGCQRVFKIDMIGVMQQNNQPGAAPIVYNADGSFAAGLAVGIASQG